MNDRSQPTYWQDIFLLTLFLSLLYFILLGTRPLFVPDEGRYAEIAREMVVSGNFVTPTLNDIKYFEKPVLFYWLSAGMIKGFGLNFWSLRSINAVLGILGCLLTYLTARRLYDRETGLFASIILGTSVLYFMMAHNISLDLPVTVFLTFTLNLFILAVNQPLGRTRRLLLYGAAISAALAVLTKGLIGLVFPGLIVFAWLLVLGHFRLLRQLYLPSCLLIFLLIAAPWHILVSLRNPEFFHFYFITQHFLRYTTLNIGHYQPFWFFIPFVILGFFPWIVFLPPAIKQTWPKTWASRHEKQNELFFLLWATLIFLFFSFSKSKLIPYILPIFPPLAILVGRYLARGWQQHTFTQLKPSYLTLLGLAGLIAGVFISTGNIYLSIGAIVLVSGAFVAWLSVRQQRSNGFFCTSSMMSVFLLLTLAALPALDNRTILPLANTLKPILKPTDIVVTYNQYYQDLPFYLEQRVHILNWRNELTFGLKHQPNVDWMIDNKTFWQHFDSKQRVFALMGTEDFARFQRRFPHETAYLIAQSGRNVLVSNFPG